jgi:hypothetical protein
LGRKACDLAEIQMSCLEKLGISRNPDLLRRKACDLAEIQISCIEKLAI